MAEGIGVGKRSPLPVDHHGVVASSDSAVSPYPRELERGVRLTDGTPIRIRPIRPEDEPRLVDLYARLSQHSAYQRFFTFRRRLPDDWFHYFANVNYRSRLALVAEHDASAGPELIGVGRYEPTGEPDVAEVAFVVQDGWQGRGLGALLLREVIAAAQSRGVRRFRAYVLADNHRMLTLLRTRVEVEDRALEDGVVELSFRPAGAGAPPR